VHKLTDSHIRATIASVKSLMEKMLSAVITPFIGWIADIYSLEQALSLSGGMVLFSGAIILVLFWRYNNS